MPQRKGIPENSSIVIPRLVCRDTGAAIDFYAATFDAIVVNRRLGPDGTVAHGLLTIGSAMLMVEAEWPTLPFRVPQADGTSPVVIFVYVPNVDDVVLRATDNGAKLLVPAQNQFWGDRTAWIMDPFGHVWTVASRVEDTTEEQRRARWSAILGQQNPEPTDQS